MSANDAQRIESIYNISDFEFFEIGEFTTEAQSRRVGEESISPQRTQRGKSRNQRFGISPAKTQRPQRKLLSELGVLRALAGGISESEMFCVVIRFAHGAQILKHSNTKNTKYLRYFGFRISKQSERRNDVNRAPHASFQHRLQSLVFSLCLPGPCF
jgi:hypothetical protein